MPKERFKVIRERNLEEQIKDMFYNKGMNAKAISYALEIPHTTVFRFLREDKIKNYSDSRLEEVARSDDYNALSLIDTFFDAAAFVSKEMQFAAIIASKYREKVAELISQEGGIDNLILNPETMEAWFANTEKLMKLADRAPKQLDTYINLYTQVLDTQREVSFVRVVADVLKRVDPELYKVIAKALDEDVAAKAVMNSLESKDIVDYWAKSGNPGKALKDSAPEKKEDESKKKDKN
jgi:hypothetical protein